ncbi:MAG: flap endonuclease-1 [Candidatus Heimdallarchaeota archaeon]|nr:flap endonuclease-1 [Candidatus Heimdallarchaeota archaeon]MCK4769801.1 flap endonuclease-1 [Candidatus Heimdallarchaeota archaeon]
MGVKKISELFKGTPIALDQLRQKKLAVDAYNIIYQFLASIRGYDGSLLSDSEGTVTSHLSGLLYRNARLIEKGIQLAYVFDGKPSVLKRQEIKRRAEVKRKAREEYEEALERGDMARARVVAQRTSAVTTNMIDDSKKLLELMGIPVIEAPQEGEAQAAHLVYQKKVWAVASQDYDSLLFGSPVLIRNLTLSGQRKLPRSTRTVMVNVEEFHQNELLRVLDITREQLIDMSIMIGTDFNPGGVKGVGPKTAFKLIKEHGSLEDVIEKEEKIIIDEDFGEIRDVFLNPVVTEDYSLNFKSLDVDGIIQFLCEERGFSKERVVSTLRKAKKGQETALKQKSLDAFFG